MPTFDTEAHMMSVLVKWLRAREDCDVYEEASVRVTPSVRIDVVTVSIGGEVVAFEGKLREWAVLFAQCKRVRQWVHKVYAVIPKPSEKADRVMWQKRIEIARRHGVGMVYVDRDAVHIVSNASHNVNATIDPLAASLSLTTASDVPAGSSGGVRNDARHAPLIEALDALGGEGTVIELYRECGLQTQCFGRTKTSWLHGVIRAVDEGRVSRVSARRSGRTVLVLEPES